MLTTCRTSSVRGKVLLTLTYIRKISFRHHEAGKRRPQTPIRGRYLLGRRDGHFLSNQPSHHLPIPRIESTTAEDLNHDNDKSPPIQYAPDSPPSLSYQIPGAALQDAKAKGRFWSYNMYKHISTGKRPLRHYCKTREQTETVAKLFLEDGAKHLGFDMEWAPTGRPLLSEGPRVKANVSMIQLASESRIAIFHLALQPETTAQTLLPPDSSLARLITSPSITKLGVAISADMTRLSKYFPHLHPHSHFELSHLYKTILYQDNTAHFNKRLVSLAEQASAIFGIPLSKDEDIRGSDWSRPVSLQQVDYAASDAYVGLMLFCEMDKLRRTMVPVPRMPAFAEFRAALGEWPGERKVKARKQVEMTKREEIVASELNEKNAQEEEDEEEVEAIIQEEQHSLKTLDAPRI